MKISQILIIIGIILAIVVLGWIGFSYFFKGSTTPSNGVTTTFPSGTLNQSTSTSSDEPNSIHTIEIEAQGSTTLPVKDFIHNGETIPDVQNEGDYYLAGSLPYCLPNIKCATASSSDFNIVYSTSDGAFNIALLSEPLGKARHEMEQFLMDRLGLSQNQLCNLNYYVGTTYWINETYDGENLGFSFCPGATPLPN